MYKCLMTVFVAFSVEALIVTIDQGTMIGTTLTTRRGKLFNAFYGIPFAQPPVGELRFKPPKEAKPWSGVLNASAVPIGCTQIVMGTNETNGDEDCLNLNVYAPLNARKGDNLSVIVYIFGGLFKLFTNVEFGPEYILDRNVIVVEPNYRLGALGFMTTGDNVISGNNQLKDQRMALKWVQKNIHYFGGNPHDVTLQGHSASAMCVHLHTLSPSSKGLFHKVIMQSGAMLDGFYGPDVIRGIAKEFATKAGCPNTTTSENMYQCFMALDAKVFPIIEQTMYVWDTNPAAVFKPSIEDENSDEPFITRLPSTADYHTPRMPWLIGLTTGEAAYKTACYMSDDGKLAAEIYQYYKILFPITLSYLWDTKSVHLDYISRILRLHYFGDHKIDAEMSDEITQLYTHGLFGIPVIKAIRSYPGPKHIYWYDYHSNNSRQNIRCYYEEFLVGHTSSIDEKKTFLDITCLRFSPGGRKLHQKTCLCDANPTRYSQSQCYQSSKPGVSHGEDVYLIYYTKESDEVLTSRDHMFSEELVKRWTNFARTGNPNLPVAINKDIMAYWEPMLTDRIEYLRIDLNGSMEADLYKGTYEFWISLPIGSKYLDYDSYSKKKNNKK